VGRDDDPVGPVMLDLHDLISRNLRSDSLQIVRRHGTSGCVFKS
jgi:hypothetical protein